jgi:hypothetical protein
MQPTAPSPPPPATASSLPAAQAVPVSTVAGAGATIGANLLMGAGAGPEVPVIAGGLNVVLEYVKNRPWFREEHWTVPVLIVCSFAISFGVWHFLLADNLKAIVNGFGILSNAHLNYGGLKATGLPVFQPTAPDNRWQPRLPLASEIGATPQEGRG